MSCNVRFDLSIPFLFCIGDFLSVACEPRGGLACINSDQRLGKQCNDYRVRYLCPEGSIPDTRGIVCNDFYETSFTDRDDPSGRCDCETVNLPKNSCLGGATPAGIRCNDVRTNRDFAVFEQKMTCKPDVSEHNSYTCHAHNKFWLISPVRRLYLPEALLVWVEAAICCSCACLASGVSVMKITLAYRIIDWAHVNNCHGLYFV